ncbi:MAG: DUF4124 domain-containing protein [Gammaproteobacteria bacterium]|nr:DUF4124 domain-containing protein [Gammaproteobacteria bacterium]
MWSKSVVSKPLIAIAALLCMALVCGNAQAEVYKWLDESGRVHYGDCPPADCNSQTLEIAAPPSAQEIERSRQRLERYQEIIQEYRAARAASPQAARSPLQLIPDDIPCFDPIENLLIGATSDIHAALTPTRLTNEQRRDLSNLFDKLDSPWRKGQVDSVTCSETSKHGVTDTRYADDADDAVDLELDADALQHRLRMRLDWYNETQKKKARRIFNFAVGEHLYFNRNLYLGNLQHPGNAVELLHLDRRSLLFLIKPRVRAAKGRIPMPEIRYLAVSDKQWALTELRYAQNRLIERRDWRFAKSAN